MLAGLDHCSTLIIEPRACCWAPSLLQLLLLPMPLPTVLVWAHQCCVDPLYYFVVLNCCSHMLNLHSNMHKMEGVCIAR
jgi:hypothetical protein